MSVFFINCYNCGGHKCHLNLSSGLLECDFCGSQFFVDKMDPFSQKIYNAEVYYEKLHDTKAAENCYREATSINPGRCYGWWGLVRVFSNDFSKTNIGQNEFDLIVENKNKAFVVATEQEQRVMLERWTPYENAVTKYLSDTKKNLLIKRKILEKTEHEVEEKTKEEKSILEFLNNNTIQIIKKNGFPFFLRIVLLALWIIALLSMVIGWKNTLIWPLLFLIVAVLYTCFFYLFVKKRRDKICTEAELELAKCQNKIKELSDTKIQLEIEIKRLLETLE